MQVPAQILAARPGATTARSPGSLVEVRRYIATSAELQQQQQQRGLNADASTAGNNSGSSDKGNLFGFVLWTGNELDRRLSTWLPLSEIFAPDGTSVSERVTGPLVNESVRASVPDDFRQRLVREQATRTTAELDFLEERLRRDAEIPTSVLRLCYLDHAMQPWYFAPFGAVFPEFAGTATIHSSNCSSSSSSSSSNATSPSTASRNSGFIFDAHVCPFTLQPFRFAGELRRWLVRRAEDGLPPRPPGRECYRDAAAGLSVFHVDGRTQKTFCRNLLLLARNFLENKLVGHDSSFYTFYVLTVDEGDARVIAGYFSVERGDAEHNLACVVVLPCFQSRGFGRFLISFSYAAERRGIHLSNEDAAAGAGAGAGAAGVVAGTPERPLSDLGEAMYFRYWEQLVWCWVARTGSAKFGVVGTSTDGGDSSSNAISISSQGTSDSPAGQHQHPHQQQQHALVMQTISDIASEVGIAVDDARETLLRLGLVHRTESKALRLLLPVNFATAVVDKVGRLPSRVKEECFC